jgi:hypothetical protein
MDEWFEYCICILKCSDQNSYLGYGLKLVILLPFYEFLMHLGMHHTAISSTK